MPAVPRDEHIRCVALEAASRVADPGTPTSGLLSRASQCETYLRSGMIRSGPRWLSAAEIGSEGVSVMVESEDLSPELLDKLRDAVGGVL